MTTSTAQLIQNSPSWETAAMDLVRNYMENGECFSSGEIAREIRIHRPDLRFSVLKLGSYIRDQFYADAMGMYNIQGNTVFPVQVPRTTQGNGRTPAGVQVFVYGPDSAACFIHDFEVDIPDPRAAQSDGAPRGVTPTQSGYPSSIPGMTMGRPQPTPPPTPKSVKTGVPINPRPANKPLKATVHNDRRVCVTREAFEAFVHAAGAALRGGVPVYLSFENGAASITLDQVPGSKPYSLATDRGRILFASPDSPFNPGDAYRVTVTKNNLTVDLTTPL